MKRLKTWVILTYQLSLLSIRTELYFYHKKTTRNSIIKKALVSRKDRNNPLKNKVGKLTSKQLQDIAKAKMEDLNANDIEAAKKIVAGSARSMGIEIVG